jgi:hypothetical protein
MAKGSCVCGAVVFEVRTPFRFFQYCHCTRCRKRTGSIHAANIAVLKDQVSWLAGEQHVKRFELASATSWSNCFCEICGSGLPWLTRNGKAWIVPSGALDEDPGERPSRNVWMSSKAVFEVPAASLPEFPEEAPPKG